MIKPVRVSCGALRKRLTLQQLPASPPTAPGWTEQRQADADWEDVATLWGEVRPLTARELAYAGQIQADANMMVTVRYYPGVTQKMRFKYTDDRINQVRYFNIYDSTDVEERHVRLDCICREQLQ